MPHTIACRTLALTLDDAGRVSSLIDPRSNVEFLTAQTHAVGLWQLGLIRPVGYADPLPPVVIPDIPYDGHEWFTTRDEYRSDLQLDSQDTPAPSITTDATSAELSWHLTLPDGQATVTLRIDGGDRDDLAFRMRLSLPDTWAVKRATYPRIRGFGDPNDPDADALLFPETWGVLRRNPLMHMTNYQGQYPAHINWCQMTAWLHGDAGVYLGMQDPDSHHTGIDMQYATGNAPVALEDNRRYLHLGEDGFAPGESSPLVDPTPLADRLAAGDQPAMQLRCHHWPPMSNEWESPYPVVLQGFRGDWYDAAQIHRSWATKQRWCRRGPLADRADASSALASVDLWICQFGFSPAGNEPKAAWEFRDRMLALREYFGVPFGIHWYHWHNYSWHSRFPDHSEPVEGFGEVVQELQSHGIVVMPYCQGRLLYRDRPDIDSERSHASVEANGQPYLEMYTPQDDWPLALCPSATWSQKQWYEAARMHWQDYGVDGVYFDQITAMPPSLCYHTGHGHALGGGNHYWRGYDQALEALRPMIEAEPKRFLSSELMADAFLDQIDLYLTFVPPLEDFVPLHAAIYGEYTTVTGRNTPTEVLADPQLMAICQGEQLLFGGQLGWLNDSVLQHPAAASYLRDLARLRAELRRFLHLGRLDRAVETKQDTIVERVLPKSMTGRKYVQLKRPAVRQTSWIAPDGKRLILLLNQATTATRVQLHIPADWPATTWQRRDLGDASVSQAQDPTATLEIPAYGVVALISD